MDSIKPFRITVGDASLFIDQKRSSGRLEPGEAFVLAIGATYFSFAIEFHKHPNTQSDFPATTNPGRSEPWQAISSRLLSI